MKKYLLLHVGFETPTDEIMAGWNEWFVSIADVTVENVGLHPGKEVTRNGSNDLGFGKDAITGYTVIEAEDLAAAEKIAANCPSITSIRVYEIRSM